jgi:hypothetical protein
MTTADNPFLQAELPHALPWDSEKHRWWEQTRSIGRWGYGLHRIRARSSPERLLIAVAGILLVLLLPLLMQLPERGMGVFTGETMQVVLRSALWFVPLVAGLFVLAGFLEGWMRWGLYESIAATFAGPHYVPTALAVGGSRRVALLNPRRPNEVADLVISSDGQSWKTLYTNDREQHLIDMAVLPDGKVTLIPS